jgi:hypothetical protein
MSVLTAEAGFAIVLKSTIPVSGWISICTTCN